MLPEAAHNLLKYERSALENAEVWRLLSAHLVHLGWVHAAMNAAALVLLALLFERFWLVEDLAFGGLFVALCISFALYFFHSEIEWYVGLSGLLHGWFVIAAVRMAHMKKRIGWALLLGVGGKLAYEMTWGPGTSDELIGGQVIEEAHFWGALAGLSYAALRVLAFPSGKRPTQAL